MRKDDAEQLIELCERLIDLITSHEHETSLEILSATDDLQTFIQELED
jgi:hypothetical protein